MLQKQELLEFLNQEFFVGGQILYKWEKLGLIKAERRYNKYRYYNDEQKKRIQFLVRLKKVGFSLKEIRKAQDRSFLQYELEKRRRIINQLLQEI